MIQNKQIAIPILAATIGVMLISQSVFNVYASESSPYDSGYDHGCDDAGISDPGDRYINQPEKGPSFHTGEFMSGYNDGFDSCGRGGGSNFQGGGQNNDGSKLQGESREGLVDKVCNYVKSHPGTATSAGTILAQLGLPAGALGGIAVDVLCALE